MIKRPYPLVSIGSFAEPVSRPEEVVVGKTYRQIGVHWWGKGVYERESTGGGRTRYQTLFRVQTDDIVFNKIWARHGSAAIVPPVLNNCYGSGEFPTFVIDKDKLEPRWFHWIVQTGAFWERCAEKSFGTSGKNRIKPQQILEIEIPLPPLPEQQRIVARIEALAGKIEAARGLRGEAMEEVAAISGNWVQDLVDRAEETGWPFKTLPEVCEINPSRKGQVQLDYSAPVSFVPMHAVDDVTGAIVAAESRLYGEVNKGHTWFIDGDVIFARITPCMQNGKAAVARNLVNRTGFGSTEFHVLRPNLQLLDADYLHLMIRRPLFRQKAKASFKGTAGHQRVPESFFLSQEIPLPALEVQHSVVKEFRSLEGKVNTIREHQTSTDRELNALLPALLDRAFKGEL